MSTIEKMLTPTAPAAPLGGAGADRGPSETQTGIGGKHLRTARRYRQVLLSPLGLATVVGLALLASAAILGPVVWGPAAAITDVTQLSAPPSAAHPLGTDAAGRDVFARIMVATAVSVPTALAATLIGLLLGTFVGLLPSVLPVRAAAFVVSGTGIALAFPALLLAIVLSITLGASLMGATLAIGFAMVPVFARLAQTLSASIGGRDFVAAARVLGVGRLAILRRHVMPNISEPLLVNASVAAGGALVAFAGLSFLGLGVQPPAFDWGRMLNDGLSKIYVNPAAALGPAAAVVFAGTVFTLLGETLARVYGLDTLTGKRPKTSPRPPRVDREEQPVPAQSVLAVRDLHVHAPDGGQWRELVKGVSLDIAPGEIVGVVGESGSGKSLLCLSIASLVEDPLLVHARGIRFDGAELTRDGELRGRTIRRSLARKLGTRLSMVFQDPSTSLNPAIHVGPQVGEIGMLHGGLSRSQAARRAVEKLGAVRLTHPERRARQYPHELSGGMRQRAMIAMGLMGAPALIIADEPTTALDVTVQREVLRLLRDINRDEGSAVLFVSHDIAVVTGFCSRVLVMYRGRLVEDLSVAALLAGEAQHPYTRALLQAVPDMTGSRGEPFATIPEDHVFPDADSSTDAPATVEADENGTTGSGTRHQHIAQEERS